MYAPRAEILEIREAMARNGSDDNVAAIVAEFADADGLFETKCAAISRAIESLEISNSNDEEDEKDFVYRGQICIIRGHPPDLGSANNRQCRIFGWGAHDVSRRSGPSRRKAAFMDEPQGNDAGDSDGYCGTTAALHSGWPM